MKAGAHVSLKEKNVLEDLGLGSVNDPMNGYMLSKLVAMESYIVLDSVFSSSTLGLGQYLFGRNQNYI